MGGAPILAGGAAEFVSAARVARLATISPEGEPHVVPVSPVLDLDRVLIASEAATAKVRNVRSDPRVSICVDEYSEDWANGLRSVILFGEAQVIEDGFEWERDRTLFYEKFPQYAYAAPIEEGSTVMLDVRIDRVVAYGF